MNWNFEQKLSPSDGAFEDFFGYSVAVDDKSIAVGSIGTGTSGAAYIFTRSGSVWSQQQKVTVPSANAGADLGTSVAIDSDTVLIGADSDGPAVPVNAQGSVYVFTRAAGVWSQQQKLVAEDPQPGDSFGQSVALSGDVAVVGVPFDSSPLNQQGSVYAFVRSGSTWTEQQKLTATGANVMDNFGIGVGVDGDKIVAGAPGSDVGARNSSATPEAANQGAAYFFQNAFSPTSIEVSVSGRVTTATGIPVRNATLTVTGDNFAQTAQTGSFGQYTLTGLRAGRAYVLTVGSKRFTFTEAVRIINTHTNTDDMNFVAIE